MSPGSDKATHEVERIGKAMVWIYYRGKNGIDVLLLKMREDRGAYWQPVTGKLESGESPEEGALREATEETGLSFKGRPESLDFQFEFYRRHWTNPRIQLHATESAFGLEAVPAQDGTAPDVVLDPNEHVACEWMSIPEAEKRVHFASNLRALEKLRDRLAAQR